jgi:hypothetical protein
MEGVNPIQEKLDKDKTEVLLKLADVFWRSHDARRSYEWKVNFALWPAIAVFAGLLLRGNAEMAPTIWVKFLITTLLIGILLVYLWWKHGIHSKNSKDKFRELSYLYLIQQGLELAQKITEELGITDGKILGKPSEEPPEPWYLDWSQGPQIVITAILIFAAIVALWSSGRLPPSGLWPF